MTEIAQILGKSSKPPASLLPDAQARAKLRKKRMMRDRLSRYGITAAGYGVVFSLALIFFYLFYEVMPIFRAAKITPEHQYSISQLTDQPSLHLGLERYEELGLVYDAQGRVTFFEQANANIRSRIDLNLPEGAQITSHAKGEDINGFMGFGTQDGQVLLAKHDYNLSFPNDTRYIEPVISYPFGDQLIELASDGSALEHLAVQVTTRGQQRAVVAGYTASQQLLMATLTSRSNLMTGAVTTSASVVELPALPSNVEPVKILIEKNLRSLFVADSSGLVHYYNIENPERARLVQSIDLGQGSTITAMDYLVGTVSLVVGTADGQLAQAFLVRDADNNFSLQQIRTFNQHPAAITSISPEFNRKGFLVGDASGRVGLHYATSARTLKIQKVSDHPISQVAISPVNGRLLALDESGQLQSMAVWNQHPQISFRALWNRVWYEGRGSPAFVWQSSSGNDEFESKFSLVPLSLGTLKAAFYAMLFAMPLAIFGAIYTAYFMSPKIRGYVKPTIEIMEALPTVILGFLAGLWLAPFAENNLPAIFSIFLIMPLFLLGFVFLWSKLPQNLINRVPDGFEAVVMLAPILFFGWLAVTMSPLIEIWFFGGSARQWLTDVGITYDQRNAMIVGIAMGFAVIPTIFSIAEDAVFTVPKHLTQGSLALGASRWQTVMGVVLPTASPGIFSAIMMGFGRAVGETMIVLMATGNSPVVNFNLFEGMRTLSANIAVELPETAVGSSHFRILFLAALVLFALTFVVNTIAEVVRQRLRARYSNL